MLLPKEAIKMGHDINWLIKEYGEDLEMAMGVSEFHKLCFPNNHRNSTYKKIKLIEDVLINEKLMAITEGRAYEIRKILKPVQAYYKVKEVKLLK